MDQRVRLPPLVLRAKEHKTSRTTTKAGDPDGGMAPKRRTCRYYLRANGQSELLGQTVVPEGMDIDDAFPGFHMSNYSTDHLKSLKVAIEAGGVLWAESDFGEGPSLLAYTVDRPDYWYGRESTLKYFGIVDYRPAVA